MVHCMDNGGTDMVPLRICVLGDDDDMFESRAMQHLINLEEQNRVVLVRLHDPIQREATEVLAEDHLALYEEALQDKLRSCQALICRPTMSGTVTERMVTGVNLPFYIATLSKGLEHIEVPQERLRQLDDKEDKNERITLIRAGDENAPAVAELTIQLVNLLLRQVHRFTWAVNSQRFNNRISRGSRRLEGLSWLTVGAGAQVHYLLRRLLNSRLDRFVIQTRGMNVTRFKEFLEPILTHLNRQELLDQVDGSMRLQIPTIEGGGMWIEGTRDLDKALTEPNIISIHLPLKEETRHLFNSKLLGKMSGALLINVSRGDIVNEADVLDALNSGKLAGYASDVIKSVAEKSKLPKDSILWQSAILRHAKFNKDVIKDPTGDLDLSNYTNIVLTPHVGGNTVDAVEAVAYAVVGRLLKELNLDPIPNDSVVNSMIES
jgi:phosphoglycerate dehydrogenase-like enzyme